MTAMTQMAHEAHLRDSKSRVGELQREIDKLTVEYHRTGDPSFLTRATKLAREKEQLSKPGRMRFAS